MFKAGDNIELASTGNTVTITSLGGTDTFAVHYDDDGSGGKLNSITLLDKDATAGVPTTTVAIKNVASAGTLAADNTNAATGADIFGETRVSENGNYIMAANTAAQNLTALDTQVKANTDDIAALKNGTAEVKADTVEIQNSGKIAQTDKGAVNGDKLYKELRDGADGNYVRTDNTTAANLTALDAALKPIDDVVASKNLNDAAAASATGDGATAIGWGNVASGERATAVGYGNNVTGKASGAFGDPNIIDASYSYAVGNDNQILTAGITENKDGSFVFGNENKVTGKGTFVLGNKVTTAANDAVILGSGSTAEQDGVVFVGTEGKERKIIHVAQGEVSPVSTDAINGTQLYARDVAISANAQEIREVGAISAALAGLHYVEPSGEEGDKFVGAVAYGNYRGESAGAIGVAYKPNPNFMFSASTSVGNDQNAYNAGVSLKFGKGETAQTRAELKKQVQFVNEENKALKAEIQTLKDGKAEQDAKIQALEELVQKLIKK